MANISAVGWVKLNQPISRAGGRWRGGNNFKAERMGGLLPWVTITNKHGEVIWSNAHMRSQTTWYFSSEKMYLANMNWDLWLDWTWWTKNEAAHLRKYAGINLRRRKSGYTYNPQIRVACCLVSNRNFNTFSKTSWRHPIFGSATSTCWSNAPYHI